MEVAYMIGDRLYVWGTGNFIRDEWLNALSTGAQRASHWIPIAQAEMALIQGLIAPWYLLLGLTAAKIGLFYAGHKQQVDTAFQHAPTVLRGLQYLRQRHRRLFDKLLLTAGRDLVTELPSGVTGEDVAFFVGRVLKGVGGLPEVTLGAVLRVCATVAAIVTATHLPGITAHAAAATTARAATDLRGQLAAQGISISDAEARAIYHDLKADPNVVGKLRELETACRQLAPILQQLQGAVRVSQ
jgi:hypothetical protein